MARTPVIGTGPVAVTTKGAHKTIPLGVLTFDATNSISFAEDWPPGDPEHTAKQNAALPWLQFLVKDGQLASDSSAGLAVKPALRLEAAHPGAAGNAITLTISNVNPQLPAETATFDLEVDVVNTYPGLKLDTIAGTIGTAAGGGSAPGLVFLGSAAPPTKLPDGSGNPLHIAGAPPHVDVKNGPDVAFTLNAVGDGGGATTFDAEVSVPTADHAFDVKVTWKKKVVGKTFADHAAQFAYLVKIMAPPAGLGVPAAGTVTLSGGADPGGGAPAKPATATAPSA